MPPYITNRAQRNVSGNALVPDDVRRSDLAAALAVAVVVAQLLLAQLTLVLTISFLAVGRVSRWRPSWLAIPAGLGAAWILAIGLSAAIGGYLAVAGRLVATFTGGRSVPGGLAHLQPVLGAWQRWLPGQLPVALVASAVLAFVLTRSRPVRGGYRPGALVLARRRYLTQMLRRDELATADGCCLGVRPATGTGAVVSWQEAAAGVLCTGQRGDLATATGLDLAIAAIQHRKTVIIVDLAADQQQGARLAAACTDLAVPLSRLGSQSAHYDPLSQASPARGTSLVMAMIGRALDHREVAYFPLGGLRHLGPAGMLARLAVADLIENLARRSDDGSRVDCMVWINGCELIDDRQVRALLALGERTGTAVVLGSAAGPVAAGLGSAVNVVAVRGGLPPGFAAPDQDPGLAELVALAALPDAGRPDELILGVRDPARIVRCQTVR